MNVQNIRRPSARSQTAITRPAWSGGPPLPRLTARLPAPMSRLGFVREVSSMATEHVVVIGAGQMGAGIAQVALQAGLQVTLVDVAPGAAEKGAERIKGGLQKLVEKGKLDDAKRTAALAKLKVTQNVQDAKGCDFAIEAVIENE